jgi:heat shock protein HtpX
VTAGSGALYDDLQRSNRRRSRALLIAGVLLVAVLVWAFVGFFAGQAAFDPPVALGITALGTAVGMLGMFVAYRSGPSIALRASKARPARREDHPQLFNVFDEVCIAAGVTGDAKPTLHIVDDPAPNAFATGLKRDDAHIAVTTGLLDQLPRYELRAVLAHELAHVTNDDIRTVTVAVATAGLVALLANVLARALWFGGGRGGRGRGGNGGGGGAAQIIVLVVGLVAIILAPLAAQAIRFAVSRQREYLADATAAETLRDPQSMVNALRRIDGVPHTLQRFDAATAHLWFDEPNETGAGESEAGPSHARAPARGRGAGRTKMARRFATHPSMAERIQRLARLNAGTVQVDAPLPPPPGRGRARGSGSPPPSSPPPSSPPPTSPPPGAGRR